MPILIKWLLSSIALLITAYIIPGVEIAGFWTALWLAAALGLLNILIKPILIILTLPVNILTLGLFTFIINGLIVLLASTIIKGFEVEGLLTAVFFSITLAIVNYLINSLFTSRNL